MVRSRSAPAACDATVRDRAGPDTLARLLELNHAERKGSGLFSGLMSVAPGRLTGDAGWPYSESSRQPVVRERQALDRQYMSCLWLPPVSDIGDRLP